MKIRHPLLIKAAGFAVALLVRLWGSTLCYRYRPLGPPTHPTHPGLGERYIYAFWHEDLLVPAYRYGRRDVWVLISRHADGRLIAEACRHLSLRVVAGSTNRQAVQALRQLIRRGRDAHLVITPDGPRGPRRKVQPGLAYLAAKTGLAVVPVGLAYRSAWRMRSWDRFALPRPWSAVTCVTGEPIRVPAGAGRAELEEYRRRIEEAMEGAWAAAERDVARQAR
jgi:lysophospholipid acyltransferase (LPLAT)-like uncharacterized protein